MRMITPSSVCKLGVMENIFGLMTTRLGSMASRAFELDTHKIPEADFGKIRGLKRRIVRTIVVPS